MKDPFVAKKAGRKAHSTTEELPCQATEEAKGWPSRWPAPPARSRRRPTGKPSPDLSGKSTLAYGDVMDEDLFKALADPTRRRILDGLTERDGQTLFEICARLATEHGLGLTRQAVSQHLAVLEAADLVRTRREGRYKFHDLNTEPLEHIVTRWLQPKGSKP
jgi:DNA-binding transcriptional ArsR family regulator